MTSIRVLVEVVGGGEAHFNWIALSATACYHCPGPLRWLWRGAGAMGLIAKQIPRSGGISFSASRSGSAAVVEVVVVPVSPVRSSASGDRPFTLVGPVPVCMEARQGTVAAKVETVCENRTGG